MGPKKGRQNAKARKEDRAHQRRQKKMNNTGHDDCANMKQQLDQIGLALKEIQGDGNCLFRALSDQLTGDSSEHFRLRKEVVEFMRRNREDFEPFLLDETSFEKHLELLSEDGTFGGNDAIVAFARLYQSTVVIHQLNEPLWQIHGKDSNQRSDRELHISYHNGDHYNSVRRKGEVHSREPPRLKLNVIQERPSETTRSQSSAAASYDTQDGDEDSCHSDYENLPNVPNEKELNRLAAEIRDKSGITDMALIHQHLEDNAFCSEAALDDLLHKRAQDTATKARSTLWREGGTGNRIFGDAVADKATSSSSQQRQEKIDNIQSRLKNGKHLSNKKRKQLKKAEKRLLTGENRKQQESREETPPIDLTTLNLQALSI